jgi:hypothetical protein
LVAFFLPDFLADFALADRGLAFLAAPRAAFAAFRAGFFFFFAM